MDLPKFAISIVATAIIIIFGLLVISTGKSSIGDIEGYNAFNETSCQGSVSCNATSVIQTSVGGIPDWFGIIILTGIGAVMISLVMVFRNRE